MNNEIYNVIAKAGAAASRAIKREPGDYEVDGLLHCGKCHTPKQTRVMMLGQEETFMCVCKCESQRYAREKEREELERRVRELRRRGIPTAEMHKWTLGQDDKKNPHASKVAGNYVEHFDEMKKLGKGLLLFGSVGTGKTYLATAIANALIDRGVPCLVTTMSEIVNRVQGTYSSKQEYIDSLNRYALLVIDDLASERDTDHVNEIVQEVIDSRYRAHLPVIVTTNMSWDNLSHASGVRRERIYSRLLEMTYPVKVAGADRRREKLARDYKELEKILAASR